MFTAVTIGKTKCDEELEMQDGNSKESGTHESGTHYV